MSADFSPNENTLITIRTNSFNAIRTFLESGVTEKIDIMYGELKNIIPCENAIQIKEIKNVTCNADETKNTDYNKVDQQTIFLENTLMWTELLPRQLYELRTLCM